jgi:hypothetical protein
MGRDRCAPAPRWTTEKIEDRRGRPTLPLLRRAVQWLGSLCVAQGREFDASVTLSGFCAFGDVAATSATHWWRRVPSARGGVPPSMGLMIGGFLANAAFPALDTHGVAAQAQEWHWRAEGVTQFGASRPRQQQRQVVLLLDEALPFTCSSPLPIPRRESRDRHATRPRAAAQAPVVRACGIAQLDKHSPAGTEKRPQNRHSMNHGGPSAAGGVGRCSCEG